MPVRVWRCASRLSLAHSPAGAWLGEESGNFSDNARWYNHQPPCNNETLAIPASQGDIEILLDVDAKVQGFV
jgi:hypothetical protein